MQPAADPGVPGEGRLVRGARVPESFCPICHPERGGRPVADVTVDGAPADGTKVRFKTRETARARRHRHRAAAEPRRTSGGVEAVARLAYDATRQALRQRPRRRRRARARGRRRRAGAKKATPLAVDRERRASAPIAVAPRGRAVRRRASRRQTARAEARARRASSSPARGRATPSRSSRGAGAAPACVARPSDGEPPAATR